jgi:hypothetical protein
MAVLAAVLALSACGSTGPGRGGSSTAARPTPSPAPPATPTTSPNANGYYAHPTPTPPPTNWIDDLRMFNPTAGWAQEQAGGAILHTTQGVRAWTVASPQLPAGQRIIALTFLDADSARLLAAGGLSADEDAAPVPMTFTSWATDDAGASWAEGGSFTVEQAPGLSWRGDLAYVSGDDGWFSANQDDIDAGLGVTLFRTVDGGVSWEEIAKLPPAQASTVSTPCFAQPTAAFANPTTGWLAGGGCVTAEFDVTQDGGATWTPQSLPLDNLGLELEAPVFTSGQDGSMLGFSGGGGGSVLVYVTVDAGETWTAHAAPGWYPHAVDFIDADTGWLLSTDTMEAGYPAGLYATHDGGETWTTLQPLDNGPPTVEGFVLNGSVLDFVSPSLGWTDTRTGTADTILQTTDGGLTWAPVAVQVSPAGA